MRVPESQELGSDTLPRGPLEFEWQQAAIDDERGEAKGRHQGRKAKLHLCGAVHRGVCPVAAMTWLGEVIARFQEGRKRRKYRINKVLISG